MARRATLYGTLFGLTTNPFPQHAISTATATDPFDPQLHPSLPSLLARTFLGPTLRPSDGIRFLWSLGYGDGARGFGKTSYLQWFTRSIRNDYGAELLEMCGGKPDECICAAYCSFSTLENLSLSNVLFDACNDVVLRHSAPLENLKARFTGTSEQLLDGACEMARLADAGYRYDFLWRLVHQERSTWQWYLAHRMRPWHQARWGRELFASVLSLLRALGMSRFVLCVDQVEDFASWNTPNYKLARDTHRLASLCARDSLFAGRLQVVLTMHPRAQRVLEGYWNAERLGQLAHDDKDRCVLLGPLSLQQLEHIATLYLCTARNGARGGGIRPFTRDSLEQVRIRAGGRPGSSLQLLHQLLEFAVDRGITSIDEEICTEFFEEDDGKARAAIAY